MSCLVLVCVSHLLWSVIRSDILLFLGRLSRGQPVLLLGRLSRSQPVLLLGRLSHGQSAPLACWVVRTALQARWVVRMPQLVPGDRLPWVACSVPTVLLGGDTCGVPAVLPGGDTCGVPAVLPRGDTCGVSAVLPRGDTCGIPERCHAKLSGGQPSEVYLDCISVP